MPLLGMAGKNLRENNGGRRQWPEAGPEDDPGIGYNALEATPDHVSAARPGHVSAVGPGQVSGPLSGDASGDDAGDNQPGRGLSDYSQQQAGTLRPGHRDARFGGLVPRCANPRCDSVWLRFWRRRRMPVFEGGWCCSERCTRAMVTDAVSREMRARGSGSERHRHRIPLGLLMVERGWISGKQLQDALKKQKAAGAGRLGHWLVRQGSIDEQSVTRAVGSQWGCPVLSVESYTPEGLTTIMPRLFLDAFGALPLRVAAGKILYLGFEDRLDPALALAVERMSGLKVESGLVQDSLFRAVHARTLNAPFPTVKLVEAASEPAIAARMTRMIEKAQPFDSRLVRVHDCLWLRMWLRRQQGATPEVDDILDVIYSAGSS